MTGNSSGDKAMWIKILEVCLGVLMTINVGLTSWALSNIQQLNVEVATIKANRFTSGDGLEVWKSIAGVKEQIASMPKETPPKWFIDRVDQMERKAGESDRRIDALANQISLLSQYVVELKTALAHRSGG